MLNSTTRYLLAAIQAVVGWEWAVSGANKVLSGTFPQTLADTLSSGLKDNPNDWYVSFLQNVVQPHSLFFGYLIEWTELAVGVAFLAGALMLLGRPRMRGEKQHRAAMIISSAVAALAICGAIMCVNFHFWMGHGVIPGINPADPNDEGIDLDALMPPISLIIMFANLMYIRALRGGPLFPERLRHLFQRRSDRSAEKAVA